MERNNSKPIKNVVAALAEFNENVCELSAFLGAY